MLILKQSTSIDIRMGPFVDATDGVAPEVGITIAAADQAEVLKANGAATAAMAGVFAAITGADGWYDYTVATGDVDTVGEVVFVMQDSSVCLPVYVRGYVVEEAVYDAMYGAASAGPLQSTTAGRKLDVSATGEAGIDWANIGSPTTAQNLSGTNIDVDQVVASVSGAVGSVTGHTNQTGDSFVRIGVAGAGLTNIDLPNQTMDITGNLSGSVGSVTGAVGSVTGAVGSVAGNVDGNVTGTVGTVNAFAAASITAAAIATDAVDADALAADAVTKIRDAILPVQNIALSNIPFTFVAASDHVTPVTGATGSAVTRSIDGGAFGAGTGTINEVANGAYSYDASAADMNGGIIIFRFTATGGTPGAADDTFVSVVTGAGV